MTASLKSSFQEICRLADSSPSHVPGKIANLLEFARQKSSLFSFISEGCSVLSCLTGKNGDIAQSLAESLLEAARITPQLSQNFMACGLRTLPQVANTNSAAIKTSPTIEYLVDALLEAGGIMLEHEEGFVCSEFLCSATGGSEERRAFVVFGPCPPVVITGCFRGTVPELDNASGISHKHAPEYRRHYQNICAVASAVMDKRFAPLPFAEAVALHKQGKPTWPQQLRAA